MNIVLSKNNHLKVGYNTTDQSLRSNLYDKFYLDFKRLDMTTESFRDACIRSAHELCDIAEQRNRTPLIMYCNNVSSDLILFSFLESKRKFQLAYIDFPAGTKDIYLGKQLAEKFNLTTKIFNLDIQQYLDDKKTFENAVRDNVYDIKNHLFASITSEIKNNFFPISNSMEIEMFRNNNDLNFSGDWFLRIRESACSYYFHCLNEKIDACPSFNMWSPEILWSLLTDDQIIKLISNKTQGKVSLKSTLMKVYQHAFPKYDFNFSNVSIRLERNIQNHISLFNRNLRMNNFYDKHSSADFSCKDLIKF